MNKNSGKLIQIAALLAIVSASALASPTSIETVRSIKDSDALNAGEYRLKISLVADEETSASKVSIGTVIVCGEETCFSPQKLLSSTLDLHSTKDGRSTFVAQLIVPSMSVRSIRFATDGNGAKVTGSVSLTSPFNLSGELPGGEILAVVHKGTGRDELDYSPNFATAIAYNPSRRSVYYTPAVTTVASLSLGVQFTIPKDALRVPAIFSVAVHDTGDKYPLVDIYPEVQFSTPATLAAPELAKFRQWEAGVKSGSVGANAAPATKRKSVPATGVIRYGSSRSTEDGSGGTASALPTDACVAALNKEVAAISAALVTTGAVYIQDCESVPPYVHIAIANALDSREAFSMAYDKVNSSTGQLELHRIEVWAENTQIVLNGFTWSGDSGSGPGKGLAKGFVQYQTDNIANNCKSGGVCTDDQVFDGNKLGFLVTPGGNYSWKEGTKPPLWISTNFTGSVVASSSTSVLKNGTCTSDATVNRWSAFGTAPSKRLIFMSSVAGSTTTAAQLCPVFQKLGGDYAIRLDGSSAAGITIDGVRKNPLTGADAIVYGSSRYVDYGLKISYPVGISDPTPSVRGSVITDPGHVPPPTNPCTKNPAACTLQ